MSQPALRCIEFVECVTDWMEGALDADARLAVEEHMAICPHCTDYVEQIRAAVVAARAGSAETASEAPSAEARETLLDAFRREQQDASGPL